MEGKGTLAIDLGSTTTVVAYQGPDTAAQLLAVPPFSLDGPVVVPSLLWLAETTGAKPLIGRQVLDAGLAHHGGPELRRDFKRLIGSGGTSAQPAEEAGALLLKAVWAALPSGINPQRLVLTAPIDTYRSYRQWLAQVCAELGVEEVALVDEPTAAAIGAGLPPGSTALVVDIGGGTVDVALVKLEGGEGRAAPIAQLLRFAGRDLDGSRQTLRCAQVIGKAGLACGGRDIDRWIADALCPGQQPQAPQLLEAAERLKCLLSSQEDALALVSLANQAPQELRLSRTSFEQLLEERGLLSQLDALLDQVLAAGRSAGIRPGDITAVLPVGGSSRIPRLRRWLEERLAGVPLKTHRPVEAVALGALALTPGVQLKDVLTHGVELRCWEQRSGRHTWHPLFVAGQGWPTDRPLEIVLACSQDGQSCLELSFGEAQIEQRGEVVFEGNLPVLRQRRAGRAQVIPWRDQPSAIALDPPGEQGVDRLKLDFVINGQGQLTAEITDLANGASLGERRFGPVR
jgi:molecular chaperone DnaK (HSP70)